MSAPKDDETYQELAKANVMRMRGQTKEAIDLCLAILRKHPENVSAHALLGDIYYEEDDLKQAAEWYELTVDLDGNSKREKALLERIRGRMQEKEHLQNLKKLGIEKKGPPVGRYIGAMAGLIVLTGIAAYFIGGAVKARQVAQEEPGEVSRPIVIPPRQDDEVGAGNGNMIVEPMPYVPKVVEDETLLSVLRGRSDYSELIMSAVYEPANEMVILTAKVNGEEARETTALMLSSDVFVHRPGTRYLTIRLAEEDKLVFSGQISRDQYDEAQALSAQELALDEVALAAFPQVWQLGGAGSTVRNREDLEESSVGNAGGTPPNGQGN